MSKILAVVFVFSTIFLASCNTSTTTPTEDPGILTGKAEGYNSEVRTIEAVLNNGGGSSDVVGQGEIDPQGNFSLKLDTSLPSQFIGPLTFCSSLDPIVGTVMTTLWVKDGDAIIGLIAQASSRKVINNNGNEGKAVARIYIEEDKTIATTRKCVEDTVKFDLNLKKGWNITIAEKSLESGLTMSTTESSSNLKWFYIPQ